MVHNLGLIILIPLIVSIISFFIPKKLVKDFGLAFGFAFFAFSMTLLFQFDSMKDFNFIYYSDIILREIGGSIHLGADGISLLMILLTNFVVMYVMFMAWSKDYEPSFYGLVFLMQFALIGVFSSLNMFLFYFFWELALIPIYFIVYRYGVKKENDQVFTRFFIYTFVGSLFILAAMIVFGTYTGTGSYELKDLIPKSLEGTPQIIFTVFLLIGFGVKIPIFPLHSWQASTYRNSPNEGTILLSGIMLKMGLYGVYRWLVPFQEDANPYVQTAIMTLCIIGVLYGAIIALRRNDLKLIAAFSSLSHVGLITAGIIAYKFLGFQGSVLQMVVHGINIVGLFYIIDIIERSTGTRYLSDLGGISTKSPVFASLAFLIILGSIAVPLTNGFPGEMLILFSIFAANKLLGIIAGTTIIIGAAYMLRVFQLAFMGEVSEKVENFKPVSTLDYIGLILICILVLAIGVYPQYILDMTATSSQYLTNLLEIK